MNIFTLACIVIMLYGMFRATEKVLDCGGGL